jgi:hypothetical protein
MIVTFLDSVDRAYVCVRVCVIYDNAPLYLNGSKGIPVGGFSFQSSLDILSSKWNIWT